jgi:ABC-type Zn uptake system ZnuABC Zn-binding protein ZnuA
MRLALVLLLTSFSVSLPAAAAEKLRVSSFSTILTEIAQEVGGDRVEVIAHIKPGVDPHGFEPKPADLKQVSEADVILLSAKHMEGYVDKLNEATGSKEKTVEVGDEFPSLKLKHEHGHHHGHSHGKGKAKHDHEEEVEDPHWWHSVANVQRATRVVRDTFTKLRPDDTAAFKQNAEAYEEKLEKLKKWIRSEVAKLPRDRRKLVTSHEAFQYFAQENGFTLHPVEGISSAEQPSSKKVAELIGLIKKQKVKAVFAEKITNPKVITEITRETGAVLGGELYADGLGEGDASTYEGMMRHNVSTIVNALK